MVFVEVLSFEMKTKVAKTVVFRIADFKFELKACSGHLTTPEKGVRTYVLNQFYDSIFAMQTSRHKV